MGEATVEEIGVTRFQQSGFRADGDFNFAFDHDPGLFRLMAVEFRAGIGTGRIVFVEHL